MVYSKSKTFKGKTHYKGKYKRKYKPTIASSALFLAKKCYSLLNVEFKVNEVQFNYTGASSIVKTAKVICLNEIPDNDTYSGRDGRKIRIKSIYLTGHFKLASGVGLSHQVTVYLIRGQNKTAISQSNTFNTTDVNPLRALDTIKDSRVLWSKQILLTPGGREISILDKFMKMNHVTMWDKEDTTGSEFAYGELALMVMSDTSSTSIVDFEGQARIRYLDN